MFCKYLSIISCFALNVAYLMYRIYIHHHVMNCATYCCNNNSVISQRSTGIDVEYIDNKFNKAATTNYSNQSEKYIDYFANLCYTRVSNMYVPYSITMLRHKKSSVTSSMRNRILRKNTHSPTHACTHAQTRKTCCTNPTHYTYIFHIVHIYIYIY